ncbi:hypothetical protein [Xanthomonas massiliensis]|uniref:hypothetical protein n=1 Tax=Xanthomonas massiliensis TaxID=1720302 RepID=UPI000A9830C8|nr:hypothetical protein [Xanthomonas massiliensis]
MRPVEFWLLAIWSAVMRLTASGNTSLLFLVLTFVAVCCALLASFKSFKRDASRNQIPLDLR